MPKNIFKIYDGRTSFWQWDRKQKLIVLNEDITEVHFSNRNMTHSIKKDVYLNNDGLRVCNVPSELLQLPRNLVAYAYIDGATVKSVKFAVIKRPMPSDYVVDQNEDIEEKFTEIDLRLEALNENKADDIYYNEDDNSIQLVANGELIGNKINIRDCDSSVIVSCEINEEDHLIVTLSDGRVIDAGRVVGADGVTFIPSINEQKILSWTNDGGLENPAPIDLNPHDEWADIDGSGTTQFIWSPM